MNDIRNYQHYASLILKQRLDLISELELKELNDWVEFSDANRSLYIRLLNTKFEESFEISENISIDDGLKRYRHFGRRRKLTFYKYVSVAASIIIIFITSLFLLLPTENNYTEIAHIALGEHKALLLTHEGNATYLEKEKNHDITETGTVVAFNDGKTLSYIQDTLLENKEEIFHEIQVPRGGEFKLILADGTIVWLNSLSKLRYPVHFVGETRDVYLEGEAYFDVMKNPEKHFIVSTKNSHSIEVLGTSFNLRAYDDEDNYSTVLESGSIRITAHNESIILEPGTMSVYNFNSMAIEKHTVDTEIYSSWRKGQFIFYEDRIEDIMKRLSRWYEMDVVYEDEKIKDLKFSGNVRKYETIENFMEALQLSGYLNYSVNGNKITLRKSKN